MSLTISIWIRKITEQLTELGTDMSANLAMMASSKPMLMLLWVLKMQHKKEGL